MYPFSPNALVSKQRGSGGRGNVFLRKNSWLLLIIQGSAQLLRAPDLITLPDCPFLAAQTVKNLPAMQETWVQSLGWEDPLEKRMTTHSSIPAWRIPWTEESGGLQFMGSKKLDTTERLIRHEPLPVTVVQHPALQSSKNVLPPKIMRLTVLCLPYKWATPWRKEAYLFYSLINSQPLEKCWRHSRCSIKTC